MAITRVRKILSLSLLLGALGFGLIFAFFIRQPEQEGSAPDIPFEMELEDFELTHGSQGRRAWLLKAERSKYDKTEERIQLVRPDFVFFPEKEQGEVRVHSLQGRLERKEGRVVLWPRVTAEYDQTRIQADRMEYEESYQELVFYGNVAVNAPEMTIHSRNGVFDLESKTVKLWGAVEVVLRKTGN